MKPTTSSFQTTFTVDGGSLPSKVIADVLQAVSRMKDGPWTLLVERKHATRSLAQNAWYWSCIVGLLSEHTGFSPDEMHEVLKAKFLPKTLAVPDGRGEVIAEFVIGGTTTTLNKIEFGEYCEQIRRWASADLSVVIPDPQEYAGQEDTA